MKRYFKPSYVLLKENMADRRVYEDSSSPKSINIIHDVNIRNRSDDGVSTGEEILVASPETNKDSLEIKVAKESFKIYQVEIDIQTPSSSRKEYFERVTRKQATEIRKKSFYQSQPSYIIQIEKRLLEDHMLKVSDGTYDVFKNGLIE